ncbi:MAG: FecR domain-containing protein [Pseudomonadota bacterium]
MADQEERLAREAARLLMRLREMPDDREAQAAIEAFRARGKAERAAWAKAERVWSLTGPRKPRGGGSVGTLIVLVGLVGLALLAMREPLRVWWLADHAADDARLEVALSSGDAAILDVGSALSDETGGEAARQVTLLAGAAFFDVAPDARPFAVRLGVAEIAVIGTAFEVALLPDGAVVAVAEGVVEVRAGDAVRRLEAGERLRLRDEALTVERIPADGVAAWRNDRLRIDGMRLGEVAALLDRRLPGPVILRGQGLAMARVSGGLDLGEPEAALRALATSEGARVVAVPGIGTLLLGP